MIEINDDAALVSRARTGDDAAFRVLVERHQDAVARTVFGMLGAGDEADDVGQEWRARPIRRLRSMCMTRRRRCASRAEHTSLVEAALGLEPVSAESAFASTADTYQ